MPRRFDGVLRDNLAAIDLAQDALVHSNKADFAKDLFRQRGIERTLEIISEAVRHLPDAMLATRPEIPWADVRAIGNLIRHEYWRVDPDMVWRIVEDDLPPMRAAIAALLGELDREQSPGRD